MSATPPGWRSAAALRPPANVCHPSGVEVCACASTPGYCLPPLQSGGPSILQRRRLALVAGGESLEDRGAIVGQKPHGAVAHREVAAAVVQAPEMELVARLADG